MRPKRTSRNRRLPIQWSDQECAWQPRVQVGQSNVVPPESYFIGLLGLGASLTASMPPIILTHKTSPKYELKQT
jgi:hypothetical protein